MPRGRGEYFYIWKQLFPDLLLRRNIQIRAFCAEIFKSGRFVQKLWSVTAARYHYESQLMNDPVMRGLVFGFDQTKPGDPGGL